MYSRIYLLFFSCLILAACSRKGCMDPKSVNYDPNVKVDDGSCVYGGTFCELREVDGVEYHVLNESITSTVSLTPDKNWLIDGPTFLAGSGNLHIAPGTVIHASNIRGVAFLAVGTEANFEARGNSTEPIVFTSNSPNPAPGDWGGLIFNGTSTYSNAVSSSATSELGTGSYGSGLQNNTYPRTVNLAYVRVEYAGADLDATHSFPAIGFFTMDVTGYTGSIYDNQSYVDYVQVYKSLNDGFLFKGGYGRMRHLVATECQGHSYHLTEGTRFDLDYIVAEQDMTSGMDGVHLVSSTTDPNMTPKTQAQVSHFTMIGKDDGDASNIGISITDGALGRFINGIVRGFTRAAVYTDPTITISSSATDFRYNNQFNNALDYENCSVFANSNYYNQSFTISMTGIVGSNSGGTDPYYVLDPWFLDPTPRYMGACPSSESWYLNWLR